MGRRPLSIGTYGDIACKWSEREGAYKARARHRDADGLTRPVARFGKSSAAAKAALRDALKDRPAAIGTTINGDVRVTQLADEWLERIDRRTDLATGTKQNYRRCVEADVKPALGSYRVSEARVPRVDAALQAVRTCQGPGAAKTMRTVLSGIFGLAVRQEAIAGKPVRDVDKLVAGPKRSPKALTVPQTDELAKRLGAHDRARKLDLLDLADFLLGTGCRIGEALACRDGVNADGEPLLDLDAGTLEINATVVRVRGHGLVVQEHPKSTAGWRVIALPPSIVDIARRRLAEARLHPQQIALIDRAGKTRTEPVQWLLFPSPRARTLRDPSNAEGDFREVLDQIECAACRGTGKRLDDDGQFLLNEKGRKLRCDAGPWSWVTSHTFRKSVATRMEEGGCTPRQIADQLSRSAVSMTQDVYFGRSVVVADAARVLNRAILPRE